MVLLRPVCLLHRLFDSGEHRLAEEHVDEIRIELGAASLFDRAYRFAEAASMAVAAAVGDRVEGIGDRDDARHQRNSLPLESSRISCAVPSFVVRGHSLGEVRKKSLERSKYLGATLGVCHHGAALLRRQLRGFVENVGERSVELPDVVEECDTLDAA